MKKITAVFAFIGFICTSSMAIAEQSGVYISPKFVYSYQRIESAELKFDAPGYSDSDELKTEKESTFGGALAIGYDFKPNFDVPVRTEIEYAIRSQSEGEYSDSYYIEDNLVKPSGSMEFVIQSVFFNAYYDIETGTPFTPYVGGGLGVAIIDADGKLKVSVDGDTEYDESASNTETNFAFNLAAGVGYDVNDNFTLDLGYRYADFGEGKTGDVGFDPVGIKGEARVVAHEVLFGLRYMF